MEAIDEVVVDFDSNEIWVPLLTEELRPFLSETTQEKILEGRPEFIEDAFDLQRTG